MISIIKFVSQFRLRAIHRSASLIFMNVVLLTFSQNTTAAVSEQVSIGELIDFLEKDGKNVIENYAASNLLENLDETDFQIKNGELVNVVEYPDSSTKKIGSICTKFRYSDVKAELRVNRNTDFAFTASAIDKPIELETNVDVTGSFSGKLHIEKGHGVNTIFGSYCNWAASIKFSKTIRASTQGSIALELVLDLNPSKQTLSNNRVRYQVSPTIDAFGEVTNIGMPRFEVVGGGVVGDIVSRVNNLVMDATETLIWDFSLITNLLEAGASYALQEAIDERDQQFTEILAEAVLGNDYDEWSYGEPIIKYLEMPTYASVALEDMIDFLSEGISNYEHLFPVSYDYLQIEDIQENLYTALLEGDTQTLAVILGSSLACDYGMRAARPLKVSPTSVYAEEVTPEEFCASQSGTNARNLGNASDVVKSHWMLTPGTTLDIGAVSIADNYQPYMQRVRYKTVSTGRGDGSCELEMRVYKKNPTASNLKPLIAIHGGSWRYRGFGFFGLESMISHFTDRGYVVFSPFYRLAGTSDGNTECNESNGQEIVADIQDALNWVVLNSDDYGASGKVKLFGQSAGAFLAGYLNVHNKSKIDRTWLMYPPTDVADLIETATPASDGIQAMEDFLSYRSFSSLSDLIGSYDSFIRNSSFPDIVDNDPDSFPPVFMMHGASDGLVPSRQSERLCTAYGGDGSYPANAYRLIESCGSNGSELHLFRDAGHILDLACLGNNFGNDKLCPAGNDATERQIEDSIEKGFDWLSETTPDNNTGPENYAFSNGGTHSDIDGVFSLSWSAAAWETFRPWGGGSGFIIENYTAPNGSTTTTQHSVPMYSSSFSFSGSLQRPSGTYEYTYGICGRWSMTSGGCSPNPGTYTVVVNVR